MVQITIKDLCCMIQTADIYRYVDAFILNSVKNTMIFNIYNSILLL